MMGEDLLLNGFLKLMSHFLLDFLIFTFHMMINTMHSRAIRIAPHVNYLRC